MIRVIGGTKKGKLLEVPEGITRALTDRIKTSIFDLIKDFIPNATVLDLFGGSGSFAIEALSRGAKSATINEIDEKATDIIEKNLYSTNLISKARLMNRDAFRYLKAAKTKESYDIIFLDPPFPFTQKEKQYLLSMALDMLNKENIDSLLIFRYPKNEIHVNVKGIEVFSKNYGISKVGFYKKSMPVSENIT